MDVPGDHLCQPLFQSFQKHIPFKGLPTAKETAELFFNYVFQNYGIPEDIVSGRGPQFISHV